MEIWVKIKQLISILFCGYRRMEIHYCQSTIANHYCRSMKNASRNLYSPGAQGAPASNKAIYLSLSIDCYSCSVRRDRLGKGGGGYPISF